MHCEGRSDNMSVPNNPEKPTSLHRNNIREDPFTFLWEFQEAFIT